MSRRQFSMQAYWDRKAAQLHPRLNFDEDVDYAAWRQQALQKLLELMGPFPEKVPLAAEIEYTVEEEHFFRQRVVFDSEEDMSVPCQVLIPKGMREDGSNPAILCSHGHGGHHAGDKVTLSGGQTDYTVGSLCCWHADGGGKKRGPNRAPAQ